MLSTLACAALAAAPTKLAAPGFSHANVDESVAQVASDHFARQLTQRGFDVVTGAEMAQLIGMERQKQLLGCSDKDSSCLAELSNALGADAVVTGSLGRFGARYTVNLKVSRARDGASLAAFSTEVGSEDELPQALSRAAADIADQLRPPRQLPSKHRVAIGLGYGLSAGVLAGAVLCFVLAASDRNTLETNLMQTPVEAFAVRQSGELRQGVGWALLGVGLAGALITGIVIMALGESAALGAM